MSVHVEPWGWCHTELFIETASLNQSKSLQIWVVLLASLSEDVPSLLGITDTRLPFAWGQDPQTPVVIHAQQTLKFQSYLPSPNQNPTTVSAVE